MLTKHVVGVVVVVVVVGSVRELVVVGESLTSRGVCCVMKTFACTSLAHGHAGMAPVVVVVVRGGRGVQE